MSMPPCQRCIHTNFSRAMKIWRDFTFASRDCADRSRVDRRGQSHPTLGRQQGGGDKGKTEERVVDENMTVGMSVKLCFKFYLILSDQSNLHSYLLQQRGNPQG